MNHGVLRTLARPETSTLVLTVACASLFMFFVLLAVRVFAGHTESIDEAIMLLMREADDVQTPWGPGWFEELVRDYTALGGIPILMAFSFFVACYLAMEQKYRAAIYIVATALSVLLLSTLLKELFDRARPDLVEAGTRVYTSSFPSAHAMMSTCMYLTFGALLARYETRRRKKTMVLVFSALIIFVVGISRIYLGVHWPTDILAGWTAGTIWALLCWLVYRYLDTPRRMNQQQPIYAQERT